jgi:hypothetical protein
MLCQHHLAIFDPNLGADQTSDCLYEELQERLERLKADAPSGTLLMLPCMEILQGMAGSEGLA